ncbi:hypothetical protein BH24ACT12_BH24ACT12_01050 [soil metagenome]
MHVRRLAVAATAAATLVLVGNTLAGAHHPDGGEWEGNTSLQGGVELRAKSDVKCVRGMADEYPCKGIDLVSFLPHKRMGGGVGSDIWGWTDPRTGREYALVGQSDGTSFVDVTNGKRPRWLGKLPTATEPIIWHDIKVYKSHAFIVSEADGHGLQVFDLTRLRGVREPRTWSVDARYRGFGNAHNIAINKQSGYAYVVGATSRPNTVCGTTGGPIVLDILTPKRPELAACINDDGYTHDTQCVIYRGPDADYRRREMCFSSNEDTLTIHDVSDKSNIELVSRTSYLGATYTHQGWLTPNQRYFLLGDEVDELAGEQTRTATYVWDMRNLDNPRNTGVYNAKTKAIDHNLYIKGRFTYQSNYRAGLRILDNRSIKDAFLFEVGYFDVFPKDDATKFNGTWSNYPYFKSGKVIVNGIEQGVYVLRPQERTLRRTADRMAERRIG